jgi:hypothetical protein
MELIGQLHTLLASPPRKSVPAYQGKNWACKHWSRCNVRSVYKGDGGSYWWLRERESRYVDIRFFTRGG